MTECVCGQEISDKSNAFRDEKASHSKNCGQERSNKSIASCDEKPSHSDKKIRSDLVMEESQSPKESSYRETPRPLQEAWWGRVHNAQYSSLLLF